MLNRLRNWFTPNEILRAREKRRLEKLLQDAGLTRIQRKRIVSAHYNAQNR
jgi:3-methyladenine DNA glycosylase Tag